MSATFITVVVPLLYSQHDICLINNDVFEGRGRREVCPSTSAPSRSLRRLHIVISYCIFFFYGHDLPGEGGGVMFSFTTFSGHSLAPLPLLWPLPAGGGLGSPTPRAAGGSLHRSPFVKSAVARNSNDQEQYIHAREVVFTVRVVSLINGTMDYINDDEGYCA